MGLLDEAIAEFQKALRAPSNRVPTYEALGQCFLEKGQIPMAATILSRALHEKGVTEDQLVGVLYLLGRCAEQRGQLDQAVEYYQRVFVVDIQFQDVGERLAALESAPLDERCRDARAQPGDVRAARHPGARARSPRGGGRGDASHRHGRSSDDRAGERSPAADAREDVPPDARAPRQRDRRARRSRAS